jgi:hypothetical protein
MGQEFSYLGGGNGAILYAEDMDSINGFSYFQCRPLWFRKPDIQKLRFEMTSIVVRKRLFTIFGL